MKKLVLATAVLLMIRPMGILASPDIVIADFEGADYAGWKAPDLDVGTASKIGFKIHGESVTCTTADHTLRAPGRVAVGVGQRASSSGHPGRSNQHRNLRE